MDTALGLLNASGLRTETRKTVTPIQMETGSVTRVISRPRSVNTDLLKDMLTFSLMDSISSNHMSHAGSSATQVVSFVAMLIADTHTEILSFESRRR